jgi:hypothetical protein
MNIISQSIVLEILETIVKGGMRQGRRASTTELVPALHGKLDGVIPPRRSTLVGFCPQARGLEKR